MCVARWAEGRGTSLITYGFNSLLHPVQGIFGSFVVIARCVLTFPRRKLETLPIISPSEHT